MSTRLSIEDRRKAADMFCKLEEGAISQTRMLVITTARTLLEKLGHKFLTKTQLNEALAHVENNRLTALFHMLRDNASIAVKAGISKAYWSFIDAAGFLFDATGIDWPYMTEGGRRSSLNHAQECAQEALAELS